MSRQLLRMSDSHRLAIGDAMSAINRRPDGKHAAAGIVPAAMIASCLNKPDAAGRVMTAFAAPLFEGWLEKQSLDRGFTCENYTTKRLPYDFIINGHKVQAKCSASTNNCIDLRPARPPVHSSLRRYSLADVDVMAVYLSSFKEVFFVPVSCFEDEVHAGYVRGHFLRNAFVEWIDAWSVLAREGASPRRDTPPRQLTFDF